MNNINLNFLNIEVLVTELNQTKDYYNVISVSYSNTLTVNSKYKIIPASLFAINIVKNALKSGQCIRIPVKFSGPEVKPADLIIMDADDELTISRRVLINEINSAINQNVLGISIVDMFGFISAFSRLADHNIFITDENREEKYFQIIDSVQQIQMPEELNENATYAEEQEYLEKKRVYVFAQSKLEALEQYLIAYDKIKSIYNFDKKLKDLLSDIKSAITLDDINNIRKKYEEIVNNMFINSEEQ